MEKINHFSNQSFPKNLRIIKSDHFKQIFKSGRKIYSANFVIYVLSNQLDFPRIGISVGRRVSTKATDRNKIKRLIREVFRTNKNIFDKNDIVLVVKNNVKDVKGKDLFEEIKKALRK